MMYKIGFTMTGTVTVEADDPVDALEDMDMFTKRMLLRNVDNVKLEYIEDSEGKERTFL